MTTEQDNNQVFCLKTAFAARAEVTYRKNTHQDLVATMVKLDGFEAHRATKLSRMAGRHVNDWMIIDANDPKFSKRFNGTELAVREELAGQLISKLALG